MRIFTLLLALNMSASYAACPELTIQTKVCKSKTGQVAANADQAVTQETVNAVTTYTFSHTSPYSDEDMIKLNFIADGKSRREILVDPDTGISLLTATTVKCSSDKLLIHTTSFVDGQFLGVMDTEVTKKGNTLISVFEGARFGRDISDVITCEGI